jgi:hypothetical protein
VAVPDEVPFEFYDFEIIVIHLRDQAHCVVAYGQPSELVRQLIFSSFISSPRITRWLPVQITGSPIKRHQSPITHEREQRERYRVTKRGSFRGHVNRGTG